MTWKTLGESLEAALASMLIDAGEGSGGTLPDAVKSSKRGPDAKTPGQVLWRSVSTESGGESAPVTTQPAEAASLGNAKGRPVHHKAPPQRRTGQPLPLDEVAGRTDCSAYMKRVNAPLSPSLTPDGASAHETAPARRQAPRSLRVIQGGRPAGSGGLSRAAYAQARGGNLASNLVVIEGGRRHWTASAF